MAEGSVPSLRDLMAVALLEAAGATEVTRLNEPLAQAFAAQLRERGLAIHFAAGCVRIPDREPGRPMTEEEQRMVGLGGG